jgi:transcriptional regulator with GAF, ATPase, and Fis domain
MTADRESEIAEAFVSLAGALATGYDVADLLSALTERCVHLLDVSAAGLLLSDGTGVLHLLSASSEASRELELFQIQRDQGPCRDCFHSGRPVTVPDLNVEAQRWPSFTPRALEAGFVSVHAVPMRLRDETLGALNLFGTSAGTLADSDLVLAQALADVASIALVQDKAVSDRAAVVVQLQAALSSRVVLEQAKGVVAHAGDLEVAEAFTVLRRYARDHNLRLTALAGAVVARRLPVSLLTDHFRSVTSGGV